MTTTLVTLKDFPFTDDFSYHRTLTCVNHTHLRWSTKNPFQRSIFFLGQVTPEGGHERFHKVGGDLIEECLCKFPDLRVVVEESQAPVRDNA